MNKIWLNTSFESSQCNCIVFPLRLSWRHDFTRELSFEADGSRWFEGFRPQGWCETEMTWSNSNKVRTDESTSLQVKMMAMQVLLASCLRQWATPRLCLLGSAGLRSDFCKTAKLKDCFTQVWAELASSSRGREQKKLGPQSLRKQKKARNMGKHNVSDESPMFLAGKICLRRI